jgi:hypothetical protein
LETRLSFAEAAIVAVLIMLCVLELAWLTDRVMFSLKARSLLGQLEEEIAKTRAMRLELDRQLDKKAESMPLDDQGRPVFGPGRMA